MLEIVEDKVSLGEKLLYKAKPTYEKLLPHKWHIMLGTGGTLLLISLLISIIFHRVVNSIVDSLLVLRPGTYTFELWARPPVKPEMKFHFFNVTNSAEFLSKGSKPVLDEVGPYVYLETWTKVNFVDHKNGTISFLNRRTYTYDRAQSYGPNSDRLVVINIPLLTATSQFRNADMVSRFTLASTFEVLGSKPFVTVTVDELVWGYNEPLLDLASYVPFAPKVPYDKFGLFYGKNGTIPDRITVYTGSTDITKTGVMHRYNGHEKQNIWLTDECNSYGGSDGSVFPPHISRGDTLNLFDKDLGRLLDLEYLEELVTSTGVGGYRFSPPSDVFGYIGKNRCYCPGGYPCSPEGLFNVSLNQFNAPVMLSFPHFYLADSSLRSRFVGISEPVPENDRFYLDVQPDMGISLSVRARIQMNLAVQHAQIRQVSSIADIVFPITWFEKGIKELPRSVSYLLLLGTRVPQMLRTALLTVLTTVGSLMVLISTTSLYRISKGEPELNANWLKEYLKGPPEKPLDKKSSLAQPQMGQSDTSQFKHITWNEASNSTLELGDDLVDEGKQVTYHPPGTKKLKSKHSLPHRNRAAIEEESDSVTSSILSEDSA